MSWLRIVAAATLTVAFTLEVPARAGLGDCGQPVSTGARSTASDALFVLRVAVQAEVCELAVCDVDSSCKVTASDALRILRVAVGQGLVLNCTGCGTTTTSTTTSTTTTLAPNTWTEVFAIITATGCSDLTCHDASAFPGGGLGGMGTFDGAYAAIVGVPSSQFLGAGPDIVEPFEPEMSYLINKLEGTQLDVGGIGLRMPLSVPAAPRAPLTPEQITVFRSWIASGAPKN